MLLWESRCVSVLVVDVCDVGEDAVAPYVAETVGHQRVYIKRHEEKTKLNINKRLNASEL